MTERWTENQMIGEGPVFIYPAEDQQSGASRP